MEPQDAFNEEVGSIISKEDNDKWIANYKEGKPYEPYDSCFYGAKVFLKILGLPGCVGLRLHNAIDDKKQFHVLITGVDSAGKDIFVPLILNNTAELMSGGSGSGNDGWPCPGAGCARR